MLTAVADQPVNAFLTETEESVLRPLKRAGALVAEVSGVEIGEEVEYRITVVEYPSPEARSALFKRFGTTQVRVALPAVVGAKMCVDGAPKGVIAPECLAPKQFLKMMGEMGAPLEFREQRFKQMRIE